MKIVFRTDASTQIGTGHVMRCLTLATALAEQGADCHFLCRAHEGHLIELIEAKGFRVSALTSPQEEKPTDSRLTHAAWLGTSQAQDAIDCQKALGNTRVDWLVVDHYALDAQWEAAMQPHYQKLLVIDDLADREHLADILLDQNLGREADDYAALVPRSAKLLIGPQYALLRPEFAQWREYSLKRRQTPALKQIMVSLGGVDKDNITSQVISALEVSQLPAECKVLVIMGRHAPWLNSVKAQAKQSPLAIEVKSGVNNMAELMANSDLAIGAAGATSWERCALGLPCMMLVLAENQQSIAASLAGVGAVQLLIEGQNWSSSLSQVVHSVTALSAMSRQAAMLSDAQGLTKVIAQMGQCI